MRKLSKGVIGTFELINLSFLAVNNFFKAAHNIISPIKITTRHVRVHSLENFARARCKLLITRSEKLRKFIFSIFSSIIVSFRHILLMPSIIFFGKEVIEIMA